MESHPFILTPGDWTGEGVIRFTESPEELSFSTRWKITREEDGAISGIQEIEVEGVPDPMTNTFHFSDLGGEGFHVRLDNAVLGMVDGTGVLDDRLVSWEFRGGSAGFEGFEVYESKGNDTYAMHAEYASADQLRTLISGHLWKASSRE
jgi:hypothetical protein